MATPDLNTILRELQTLTQASQSGRISRDKLQAEVMKVTGKLQKTLATLNTQLPAGASAETSYLMEVFQAQIRTVLEASGLAPRSSEPVEDEVEDAESLNEDLQQRKRGGGGNVRF